MKVKCISDCEGDYWDLTVGKEYNLVKECEINYGKRNDIELYQKRLVIIDDTGEEYSYPLECFDYNMKERNTKSFKEPKLFLVGNMRRTLSIGDQEIQLFNNGTTVIYFK